jgi:hypothetical protein
MLTGPCVLTSTLAEIIKLVRYCRMIFEPRRCSADDSESCPLLVQCELPKRFSGFPIGSSSSPCVAPQPIVQATRRRSARISPRIMIWTFQYLHARVDFEKRNAGATAKWSGPQGPASRPAMPRSFSSSTNLCYHEQQYMLLPT